MSPYQSFAQVYDVFMADMPVDDWVLFIERLWSSNGLNPDLVLDIGCGTGAVTVPLARKGYNVIGIDISEDMLSEARQKADSLALDILFLNQDMREFELYGTVDSIICVCDTVNYLRGGEELRLFFSLARNYLNDGGLFIFDINTEYKYAEILSDNTFSDITDSAAYIWENAYYPDKHINEYLVTFFIGNDSGKYNRFEELHEQYAFNVADILSTLQSCGFTDIQTYDADGFGAPSDKTERIFFAVTK